MSATKHQNARNKGKDDAGKKLAMGVAEAFLKPVAAKMGERCATWLDDKLVGKQDSPSSEPESATRPIVTPPPVSGAPTYPETTTEF